MLQRGKLSPFFFLLLVSRDLTSTHLEASKGETIAIFFSPPGVQKSIFHSSKSFKGGNYRHFFCSPLVCPEIYLPTVFKLQKRSIGNVPSPLFFSRNLSASCFQASKQETITNFLLWFVQKSVPEVRNTKLISKYFFANRPEAQKYIYFFLFFAATGEGDDTPNKAHMPL